MSKECDLIVKNAAVYSVKMNNEEIHAEAVAVKDGKIAFVGSNEAVMEFAGDGTEIIDAGGASLLPGLGDGHIHVEAAYSKTLPTVNDIKPDPDDGPEELIAKYKARLKEYTDAHQDADFIMALGWDQGYFNGSLKGIVRILSRKDLDEICPDVPLIVSSYCGHAGWVNTKALERAGWARPDFPDIPGGIIYREPDGFPTGHLTEPAVIGQFSIDGDYFFTDEMNLNALKDYQAKYGSNWGITMTTDLKSTGRGIDAVKKLAKSGSAKMRFSYTYSISPGNAGIDYQTALERVKRDQVDDLVYVNTLKFFIEGEVCNETPYTDAWCEQNGKEKGYKGNLIWDPQEMYFYMNDGVKRGFNIHIHAMGSHSVLEAAKLCARCRKENPDSKAKYIIAHHMAVTDEALKIMSENGIIAQLQPYWMYNGYDTEVNYPNSSVEPEHGWFANKCYEDAGIIVAYGSDFPVTFPAQPLQGIGCAMTRSVYEGVKDYDDYKGTSYHPEEAVTLKQALKASTVAIAYQLGIDDITGTIEEGKSADFVLLTGNIEKTAPADIYGLNIAKTFFKGEEVYSI